MTEQPTDRSAIPPNHHETPSDASGDVLDQLRVLIGEEAGKPDAALPTERELAARFDVSRRALRRALSVLEREGRIWRRQGKGTFIAPAAAASPSSSGLGRLSNRTNFFEVMEVRLQIEPALAQLAALRASGEQIAMLRRLAARTGMAWDAESLERWDSAFHRAVAEAAGNRLFLDLFGLVDAIRGDKAWQIHREKARSPAKLALYFAQHRELVDAIAARAPADAWRIMRGHIVAVQEALAAATEKEFADAV
jgi:GntR family transcriptional regulator, transcriptional repressor for pyruvate dehydrogenase complex